MPAQKNKRPFLLKLLVLGFLFLSLMGWLRLAMSLRYWDFMLEMLAKPGPLYIALTGAIWGTAALGCALCLWLRYEFAPRMAQAVTLLCSLWYWVDFIFLHQNQLERSNWPFLLGSNLIILLIVFGGLFWIKKNSPQS